MVSKSALDAEAREDLDILSRHYKGANGFRHHASRSSRPISHSTNVVSLADLSPAKRQTEQKRGIATTLMKILRSRSNQVADRREQRTTKNYVIENYERDTRRILRDEGINPIVGASSQSLIDESDDDSNSLESELQKINDDVGSLCESTGSSLPQSQVHADSHSSTEDRSFATREMTTSFVPPRGLASNSDDPWSFFLWFFGCADESMDQSPKAARKRHQSLRDMTKSEDRDDVRTHDGESLYTDYTHHVSEADHSILRQGN
jgi:hypothetical protein